MKKQSSPISHVASRRSVNLPNSIEEFLRRQSVALRETALPRMWVSDAKRGDLIHSIRDWKGVEPYVAGLFELRPEVSKGSVAVDMLHGSLRGDLCSRLYSSRLT